MNEEIEQLKDKIIGFLDKKGIQKESQYFLLLSIVEDLKDEIIDFDDDEEEPEEGEDDEFEDFEEPKEKEETIAPAPKPPSDHGLKLKKLLKNKK